MSDVTLNKEAAKRIANCLEELYHHTNESAYDITEYRAARDAMEIRDCAGITPNPDLLEDAEEPNRIPNADEISIPSSVDADAPANTEGTNHSRQ